jgi:N-acetylneuraminate synthase
MKSFHLNKPPFLIAEIGINHNGSMNLAKKLIILAKEKKFDAVKIQKREPDICVPEYQKNILRETPWGQITYLDYKKKIEFNINQVQELKNFSIKNGIDFFVSCWDIKSLKKIKKINLKYNKIPSAMITNLDFLNEVAKQKKKTFISTGMCSLSDIDKAVKIFKKNKCKFAILHCVSLYPCQEKDLNLSLIPFYKNRYKCEVGYSGHESTVSPTITAYMLGAEIIERHITLDRSMWGTDQAASLSSEGMTTLVDILKKINVTIGHGKKKFLKKEKIVAKKMRYWN